MSATRGWRPSDFIALTLTSEDEGSPISTRLIQPFPRTAILQGIARGSDTILKCIESVDRTYLRQYSPNPNKPTNKELTHRPNFQVT